MNKFLEVMKGFKLKEEGKSWSKVLLEYIGITIGLVLMAISINSFLEPHLIAPGGVTGLAIVVKKVTGISVELINAAINVPLFIAGLMVLGAVFGVKTLYATFGLSFFIAVLPKESATDQALLAAIFGGVLIGLGLGIIFKSGATTGGTDLAAAIMNKKIPGFTTSKFMMIIDSVVVVLAGIINQQIDTVLYSMLSLYILIKAIDQIQEGISYEKAFYIISSETDKIAAEILKELDRGATALKGRGMYTGEDKEVLFCVVNRTQISKLKDLVNRIDKRAFVIVTEVHEVLGEGFGEITENQI